MARPVTRGGARGGEIPLEKISPPLKKCVGHHSKLLGIVQKFCVTPRKLFAPPGVQSWIRACKRLEYLLMLIM